LWCNELVVGGMCVREWWRVREAELRRIFLEDELRSKSNEIERLKREVEELRQVIKQAYKSLMNEDIDAAITLLEKYVKT